MSNCRREESEFLAQRQAIGARITRLPDYSSDKLYVNDLENAMAVYYDEDREPVAVVTPQDATANGLGGMNDMAQLIVVRIRERAGK